MGQECRRQCHANPGPWSIRQSQTQCHEQAHSGDEIAQNKRCSDAFSGRAEINDKRYSLQHHQADDDVNDVPRRKERIQPALSRVAAKCGDGGRD